MNYIIKAIPWAVAILLLILFLDVMELTGDAAIFAWVISIGLGIYFHHLSPLIWLQLAPMHDDFARFSAVAEEEIEDNEFDTWLWADALIKCNGDESKRKITYMKLRATQLIREQYDEA